MQNYYATLEALLNAAPIGFYLVDANMRIRQVNPKARLVFGDIKGLIGGDFVKIIHLLWPERYADEVVERFRHTLDTGEPYFTPERIEERLDRKVVEYYEWQLHRISLPGGQYGVVCYFSDISQHVLAQRALVEADRRKDEFLATLAHELRNPLAPLRNGLQVMKLANNNAAAIEQVSAMMDRQLSQMVRLLDDLLDVSRISRGKIELKKERVEVAKVVQQAVENSRSLIDQASHELLVDVPPDPIYIDVDIIRLAQVFTNLLNNAAKYTKRGGRIWLTVQREGSDAVVIVKDNGVGIAIDMLPRVFELFTQVDGSLEKSHGGLGIGLSLVKGLVEMHGGSVEARSDGPGAGCEFVVRMPVVLSHIGELGAAGAAESKKSNARRRILVVDDNHDGADSLALMLQLRGNDTQTAYDGLEAVEVAAAFRPDLVLLDIGMPKLNGYDTARRLRDQPWGRNILLVALTGWGQEEDRRKSCDAGFDLHMVKPIGAAALEKLLDGLETGMA